jgi:hypothetical protein
LVEQLARSCSRLAFVEDRNFLRLHLLVLLGRDRLHVNRLGLPLEVSNDPLDLHV